MRVIGVEEARAQLAEVLEQSQGEAVCITRRGKPVALVRGVVGQDLVQLIHEDANAPRPTVRRARDKGVRR